ncbi:hypothetical protein TNCV_2653731 [Trichonephila clavipes]|nr:hypothetical protein TNCV_2653731 [Trichonephila clavipes]
MAFGDGPCHFEPWSSDLSWHPPLLTATLHQRPLRYACPVVRKSWRISRASHIATGGRDTDRTFALCCSRIPSMTSGWSVRCQKGLRALGHLVGLLNHSKLLTCFYNASCYVIKSFRYPSSSNI